MSPPNSAIKTLLDKLVEADPVLSDPKRLADFNEATEHPYMCRCEKCLDWWDLVGPER